MTIPRNALVREVLCSPSAFTSTATWSPLKADDGTTGYTVHWDAAINPEIALGPRQRRIEKQVRESLPGQWSFRWDVEKRTCVMTQVNLPARINHKPHAVTAHSVQQAIDGYPDLALVLGTDEHGEDVGWRLKGEATTNALMFGNPECGKTNCLLTAGRLVSLSFAPGTTARRSADELAEVFNDTLAHAVGVATVEHFEITDETDPEELAAAVTELADPNSELWR